MASSAEQYLKPEVIRQVSRLDLRAKFIVEGFIAGLHASPFHGFSVEFSEHRKYTTGDNISDIDWNVFAKTDRFYIKKFQAETNLTGYMAMDLSGVDGIHVSTGIDQVRVRRQPGRRPGLSDDPPARPGGPDRLRRGRPPELAPSQQTDASGQHPLACWRSSPRLARRRSPRACTRPPA